MLKSNHKRLPKLHYRLILIGILLITFSTTMLWPVTAATYPFQDASLSLDTRLNDLMSRLTQDEKISFFHQWIPAISRLGIPSFRTGTEALHGIAWLGNATVFPQPIGMGATWDPDLIKQIGSAVGDEARGFNKRNPTNNGLSLWAPVVDLERDPRAGRFEEGYGEDPYLIGQMSTAYCQGIKGDDPFYYKAIPTLKHFYAYNQEANRDTFNVSIDARNMREYYMKSFQYAITSGAAKSMMTSYNLVNGVPSTVSPDINNVAEGNG
jgi:beta-glucosidase